MTDSPNPLREAVAAAVRQEYHQHRDSMSIPGDWKERWDEAHKITAEYDKALRSDDPRFRRSVQILDIEGTALFYQNAFLLRYRGFLLLFTEHHRWRVFDPEELYAYAEFKRLSRIGTLKRDE